MILRNSIVLGLLLMATSCFGQRDSKVNSTGYATMLNTLLAHSVPEISVEELAKDKENYILLDAREKKEYKVSHLEGAQYVGYLGFSAKKVKQLPKDKPIVVYCSVGYRSEKITEKLKKMGFQDVQNLYGGIFEWVNQGNNVVTGEEANPTQKVHAYDKVWGTWLKQGEKVY